MKFLEFSSDSPLYEETMELRFRTFFKSFGLPKSITPDELEPVSLHLMLLNKSELLAYGRLSPLGKGDFRISQIIVPKVHRRNGYASVLLSELMDRAKSLGAISVQLNAQVSVQKLYENCGFVATEEPYIVKLTGVEHVKMVANSLAKVKCGR
ncbi:GNAT family N-acetyltransferase [Leucothrix arctica]|uniref:N-acetyltransferase n=1 Tax=Leucothrix arctica TaxID=1481894 RepID=A0A317CI94_9GAMM|nr:GNAT family N-acetyltransferase [Leucothrix arctica]PWQ96030.1 N-acetyltransferase [Leucothrix arctica]